LAFSPVEAAAVSEPLLTRPTDSPEFEEEQRQHDEFLNAHVWPQPERVRRRTSLAYDLTMPGFPRVAARLPLGHEHMLCSIHRDMWRPGRTRVLVRSFAGGSRDVDTRKLEWLRADLPLGQTLSVDIRA